MEGRNFIDISTLVYGKVPPQAKEIEEVVLGSMIRQPSVINDVKDILKPEDFYSTANQIICKAIFELSKKSQVEILLLIEYLKSKDQLDIIGGPFYLSRLEISVTTTAHINKQSRIIKQKSIQRNLIKVASIIINDAYEDSKDVFDLLSETKNTLNGISLEIEETNVTRIEDVAMNIIAEYDRRAYYYQNNLDDPNAVYTGLPEWDKINGRLFSGLYVVAARSGMGKGVHMTELCCRMGKKIKVGVVNGEMTEAQLLTRIGCNLLNLDNYLWKKIDITPEDQETVKQAMEAAIQLSILIESRRDIEKIANKIMLWKQQGVRVVLADFLTIFRVPEALAKFMTDRQQVNYILSVLVFLAKDLDIPIILYAQMNRENLKRKSGEPNLGDLKESGSIEELAFQVSFLHRPEYYDPNATEDEWGENVKNLMYQIIMKHRDGMTGRIKFKALLNKSKILDWEDSTSASLPEWKPTIPIPFDGDGFFSEEESSNELF